MLIFAFAWLLIVNIWTMLLFRQDKQRAIAGARRLRESELLGMALLGGTPGAFAARRLFRHKTRKQPFSLYLMLIAAIQAGAAIGSLVYAAT